MTFRDKVRVRGVMFAYDSFHSKSSISNVPRILSSVDACKLPSLTAHDKGAPNGEYQGMWVQNRRQYVKFKIRCIRLTRMGVDVCAWTHSHAHTH